jgi:ABC-type uncharacterized transport system substrate-binding protein
VGARVASLQEIETYWSLDDLEDASLMLDLQIAADAEAMKPK